MLRHLPALGLILAALVTAGAAAAAPASLPLEVSGATYAEYDARSGVWLLRGSPVIIVRGATRLEAAQIRYDERGGIAVAAGGVVVQHETLTLRAVRAEVRLRQALVIAEGDVIVTARRDAGAVTLAATRVEANLAERRVVALGRPVVRQQDASLSAARLEFDEPAGTVAAVGGAELILPEGRLSAGRIDAFLPEDRAEARDGVRLTAGDLTGQAPQASLDRRAGLATLSGGVVLRRGADVLTAERITIDLRTRRVVATGAPRLTLSEPAR